MGNNYNGTNIKGEYLLIEIDKAWDSEAIDWEDKNILVSGTYEEVFKEFSMRKLQVKTYYNNFKKTNTNPFNRPDMFIEKEGEDYFTIYYPHAIAKTTYKIVKNEKGGVL